MSIIDIGMKLLGILKAEENRNLTISELQAISGENVRDALCIHRIHPSIPQNSTPVIKLFALSKLSREEQCIFWAANKDLDCVEFTSKALERVKEVVAANRR